MGSIVPVLVAALCLVVAMSPWVWMAIRARRGTAASVWGTQPVDAMVMRLSNQVSASFDASLRGRMLWVWLLVCAVCLLYLEILVAASAHKVRASWLGLTFSYACCWLSGGLALAAAWCRVGRGSGVSPGLIANFFCGGGLLGSTFAVVLNSELMASWISISPNCNPTNIKMDVGCNVLAELLWILTPGLVEETSKSVWLFFRLRRSAEDLPGRCCFCLPASSRHDCGCWFKLAPTPYHVLLCALASGAGFESFENLLYVFWNSGVFADPKDPKEAAQAMVTVAASRLAMSSMHMIWTGLIGLGLARRMFLPLTQRPSLLPVLLPSMLAHGTFDYSLSALQAASKAKQGDVAVLFFGVFVGVIIASCCLFGHLTGCKGTCFCADSCCCAPDFWENLFGADYAARQVIVGAPVIQLQPSHTSRDEASHSSVSPAVS